MPCSHFLPETGLNLLEIPYLSGGGGVYAVGGGGEGEAAGEVARLLVVTEALLAADTRPFVLCPPNLPERYSVDHLETFITSLSHLLYTR